MANDLTNIMPKILARGLLALREQASMPRLVNGDYSRQAAEKGDTIDVPIPTAIAVGDVTPSNTPPAVTDTTPSKVQIALDNWKSASFAMSDKDMTEVNRNTHFIPMQMSEAVRALANVVNEDIFAEYKGVYGYTGTAGSAPFASTVADATNARKVLHSQRAPRDNRRLVLDFDAEANALALSPFSDAEKVGGNGVKIEGEVGRKFGMDIYADDAVPLHTAGTLAAQNVAVASTTAAGATTLKLAVVSVGVGNTAVGDIFSIAGNSQTYTVATVVSAISSAAAKDVTISPPLAAGVTAGDVVTFVGSHRVNLAFHRDAFAFANRPLVASTQDVALGSRILSMTDPQTGITLRLEVSRQHKQVVWEFDILWGAKLVRPELAARLAG